MLIRVVRSGRRHKGSNRRFLEAMVNAGEPTAIGDQLQYVGTDSRRVALEVVAVPDDRNPGGLAVIHAMPVNFRRKDSERT
jgi:hypothetical protein